MHTMCCWCWLNLLVGAHSMLTGRCEAGVDDVSQLSVKLKLLPTGGEKREWERKTKETQTDRQIDRSWILLEFLHSAMVLKPSLNDFCSLAGCIMVLKYSRPLPSGNHCMKGCKWSAVIYKYGVCVKVTSTWMPGPKALSFPFKHHT